VNQRYFNILFVIIASLLFTNFQVSVFRFETFPDFHSDNL